MHTKWSKKMQRMHTKLIDKVIQGSISRHPAETRIENNMLILYAMQSRV